MPWPIPTFAYWHSATFNNDGTKPLFSCCEEWGGRWCAKCRPLDKPEWGSAAIFEIVNKKLVFKTTRFHVPDVERKLRGAQRLAVPIRVAT
ncbi:MAG: hypothetical protein IPP90_15865 [Gemmatimonadaceae bacterium]|nr:hypothetical protein [Gemmatimonadaceae bacterium]